VSKSTVFGGQKLARTSAEAAFFAVPAPERKSRERQFDTEGMVEGIDLKSK